MKDIRISTTLLLLTLLCIGCERDAEPKFSDNGYLIFGHFYGECLGEGCVEIFRLEANGRWKTPPTHIRMQTDFTREATLRFLIIGFNS